MLEPEDDAATVNWGKGWKMPTREQFIELRANTDYEWATVNGVQGGKLTSTVDGYTDKFLFFPAAGGSGGGIVIDVGTCGYYRSAINRLSIHDSNTWAFTFKYDKFSSYNGLRCLGFSVRPVRSQNL